MSSRDINYILSNLSNGRTVEFVYAPKDISKYYESDFIYDPRYGYYNKFYLTNDNGKTRFIASNNRAVSTNTPSKDALRLFDYYYKNPDFGTMIALTDNEGNNLIFYNSDNGTYYLNRVNRV